MPPRVRQLALAAACAGALIVSGCGGGGYKDDLGSAENQFKKSLKGSVAKIQAATTKQQYAGGVNEFQRAITTLERRLRSLDPPSRARAAQARLLATLDTLSRDLGAVLRAVDSGDIEKVRGLQTRYLRDLSAVQSAGKALHEKAG